jgi:molybdate transport repressor ModE-like protein
MRKKKCVALPTSVLPRLRVMCGRDAALAPGRVQVLELTGETGSMRSAAARMGMACMTSWMHVKTLNRRFRSPVVVAKRGGKAGGGAVLTKMGQKGGGAVPWIGSGGRVEGTGTPNTPTTDGVACQARYCRLLLSQ